MKSCSYLNEVCCCDELALPVDLVPQMNFLLGDVPQTELAVQGGAQEKLENII